MEMAAAGSLDHVWGTFDPKPFGLLSHPPHGHDPVKAHVEGKHDIYHI